MEKVTLRTIAEETGLSKFAVSRALSGKSGVSSETRDYVVQTATRLGYKKPVAVAALRTLGVVFDDTDVINSELNMQIQSGIRQEAEALGYSVRMHWTHDPDELERFARQSAGLLIVGPHNKNSLDRAYATGTPVVRSGWLDPLEQVDLVTATDHEAGAATGQYLVNLGHREIAYVHGIPGYRGRMERLYGLREEMEKFPDAVLHNLTWGGGSGLEDAMRQLMERGANPTAYFCAHDGLAVTVISELLSQGKRIPQDVSIVGFGDFSAAQQILPQLTTVKIPGVTMGRTSARRIVELISQDPERRTPLRIYVPCYIVERKSCAPCKPSRSKAQPGSAQP